MNNADRPQVFISYAHDDVVTVRKLVAALQDPKVNVWFDKALLVNFRGDGAPSKKSANEGGDPGSH